MKRAALLLAIALTGCNPFDPGLTYRVDGWCLRHSGEGMEMYPHATRPVGTPDFLVPADFALGRGKEIGRRALIATYSKGVSLATNYPDQHRGRIGCRRVPRGNGLDRLIGDALPNCGANERVYEEYVPTDPSPDQRSVYIRCTHGVANCRFAYMLNEDWNASVSLPRADLDRWDEALRVTRDYFETYITDCGT